MSRCSERTARLDDVSDEELNQRADRAFDWLSLTS
jgi:hypothetical protein